MRSCPSPCMRERTVRRPSSRTSMLMSSGATPGIGATTMSSRSFSKTLTGTAVASVMWCSSCKPDATPRVGVALQLAEERMPGQPTPDAERRQQWEREGRWAAWIRNDAGDVSGWHHHAGNDTYVYVSRGSLTIAFGPGGAESVVARAGDFTFI